MGREDVAYVDVGGLAFFLNRSVSPASSCISSFSNSEMKPRAMARSLGAQKNAARHRMTKQDYEMIVATNVKPLAIGDARLPTEMIFDDRDLCRDSQAAFQFSAAEPMLSGDEEEAADREEEPIDLSEDDEVDNQTAPVADAGELFFETAMLDVTGGDAFYQTAAEDGGPEMGNQTGRSAVNVETNAVRTPQQNRRP
ncbi:hypothetical protein R1sor_026544 [Riccia sorocarpa]|uniref:Uncharacterized protein n=1 Tax=Riccia sorocarpa TaxID=122646 RepID=A0ABD3GD68_9MARC